MALLESRIAFIRDLAQRGGIGATLAARDAAMIVELALRELLRRYAKELPPEAQAKVGQAIAQQAKGGRGKMVAEFTLGQLVGVIRESRFFDLWATATGKPLITLRMINLDALNAFRNKHLTHVADFEQLTDPAAQVSPGTAQFLLHCVDELIKAFGIESLESLPPEPGPADIAQLPDIGHSPYVGLRPFEARHHDLFFGREQESEELHQQVLSQPFVALIGNSGSGKSSLIGAGLLPRLPAADWRVISLQPRTDLFDSLAASLVPALYPDPAEQAAQREKLARLLAEPDYRLDHLLHTLAGSRRVLLLVDQFEEVFTLNTDRSRQRRAVELLLTLLRGEAMTLLLSLRADYFGHCLDLDPLRQTLARWPALTLGAMGEAALIAAITRPAERSGLSLEDGLADTIVADLGDEPGQLPLLQTALDELWQRSDRRKLTHAGYRAIGGVAQALARKADEFLARYDAEGQDRLRRIFLQLIRPGEGEEDTRQLATESQVGADNWELVAQLASARLVVTGRIGQTDSVLKTESVATTTVELAHEALIRHWQTLRDWITENRAFRLWQNKLRDSRAEWANHAQDEGYLLRGAKLLEAEERLVEKSGWLTEDEKAFIAASAALRQREADEKDRQRRERERLQKRVLHTIAAALVVALGLTGLAGWQWRVAEVQTVFAKENFRKARQAMDDLTEISESDELARSDMEPFRQKLLGKALKHYQALSMLYADDADMQLTVANAAFRLASIKQLLGDKTAIQDANRCIDVLKGMVKKYPESLEYRRYLASSYNDTGLLLQGNNNNYDDAIASYKMALEVEKSMIQIDESTVLSKSMLAKTYINLASIQAPIDRLMSIEMYNNAVITLEQLAQNYPNELVPQNDLAAAYAGLGSIYSSHDKLKALGFYEKAVGIGEKLTKEQSETPLYQHNLAGWYNIIGRLKIASDDEVAGYDMIDKSIKIREKLAQDYPEEPEFQKLLAVSYYSLGIWYNQKKNIARELEFQKKSLHIRERLTQLHPKVIEYYNGLANEYNSWGLLRASDDKTMALALLKKASDIEKALAEKYPDNLLFQDNLAKGYVALGSLQYSSEDMAGSSSSYQEAARIFEQLIYKQPGIPEHKNILARTYNNLGQAQESNGKAEAAKDSIYKAVQIREQLALDYSNEPDYQIDLATNYINLGKLLDIGGDHGGALKFKNKAAEMIKLLAQDNSILERYRNRLANVLYSLAYTEILSHHPKEAIAASIRALELDPSEIWNNTNLAFAYLLDNQYAKAKAIYMEYKDEKLNINKTFAQVVLGDFKHFRDQGITHPDMAKIEKLLREGKQP